MSEVVQYIRDKGWAWSIEPVELMRGDNKFVTMIYEAQVWDVDGITAKYRSGNSALALEQCIKGMEALLKRG